MSTIRIQRKVASPEASLDPTSSYSTTGGTAGDAVPQPLLEGDIINGRYQVVKKFGSGRFSTVWSAVNISRGTDKGQPCALKILKIPTDVDVQKKEIDILHKIQSQNPTGRGYENIGHLMDSFDWEGHRVLVQPSLAVSILEINRSFEEKESLPMPLCRKVVRDVLNALSYLHEECGIVHADVKPGNIMLDLSDDSRVKEDGDSLVLPLDSLLEGTYNLIDFGAAHPMPPRGSHTIQPPALRAPEVLLGAEWDTKADVWSVGCILFELVRRRWLFNPFFQIENSGLNEEITHLCQIVGLFGEVPKSLVQRGRKSERFFDRDGQFRHRDIVHDHRLEDVLQAGHAVARETIPLLAAFLRSALQIDPEKRWSASQLLGHEWLREDSRSQ
ncbi:kinase-like protein [Atractiella rhizophila]|nr:kinase-like protein [Atractiella rhizophila]